MSKPLVVPADCDEQGVVHLDIPAAQHRALCRARFAGQRVDVEIRHRKSKRSIDQNAWMHAAFKGWSDFLGYGVDELKREMLALVFGTDEVTSPLTGEVRIALKEPHTSGLNTAQFCELMERAMVEAANTGYLIEEPDEWKKRKAAEAAKKGRAA